MSILEQQIQNELTKHKIKFELHKPVPLDKYPWKTDRSKTSPKCDIYLTDLDLYIEVKGFMTYQAVSKLSFLSRQNFNYYIFQGTEPEWNPFIGTYISFDNNIINQTNGKRLEKNINHQINELVNLKTDSQFLNNISNFTLKRLKNYIGVKIDEYTNWNEEWY